MAEAPAGFAAGASVNLFLQTKNEMRAMDRGKRQTGPAISEPCLAFTMEHTLS